MRLLLSKKKKDIIFWDSIDYTVYELWVKMFVNILALLKGESNVMLC